MIDSAELVQRVMDAGARNASHRGRFGKGI